MSTPDLDSASVLATLLESVPCGVLVFDNLGNLRVANLPLAGMLGIGEERLRELRSLDQVVAELAPRFASSESLAARWLGFLTSTEANWDELELLSPGRKVIERFARPIIGAVGERLGWLEVYREVTGQRLIEKKLFHTERMVALGQLVSSVAHEINNPLTSIFGYAQLMLSRRDGSPRSDEPQLILEEAKRASRIARNLLLFAREAQAERAPVNLNEIVQHTVALSIHELSRAGIQVNVNLHPNPPLILADAAQLQQVVLNLVTNAEQAIGPTSGQGRIWLRTRRVSAERVALDVADDGPGIAPELISHIFDPFFTTKPPGVGTGIGLSIVRGIVHEHGGEVSVHSQPGRGAMFTVEFATLAAAADEAFTSQASPAAALPAAARPPAAAQALQRILVVEDEPTVARLIADVLAEDGYSVDTVLGSHAALDLLRRRQYELLICDLQMPYLDGRGLYRELRRMNSPLAQRLVFVTGDIQQPRNLEFLEDCGVPCLAKPFLVEELKELVHGAMEKVAAGHPADPGGEVGREAG